MQSRKHRVLVYGTLLTRDRALVSLDGYAMFTNGPFPFIVPTDEPGAKIWGEVHEVDDETLARLDRLEGVPDHYRRETVTLSDGSEAYAYVYAVPFERLWRHPERILDGVWRGTIGNNYLLTAEAV